jgi:hypothetical protein
VREQGAGQRAQKPQVAAWQKAVEGRGDGRGEGEGGRGGGQRVVGEDGGTAVRQRVRGGQGRVVG